MNKKKSILVLGIAICLTGCSTVTQNIRTASTGQMIRTASEKVRDVENGEKAEEGKENEKGKEKETEREKATALTEREISECIEAAEKEYDGYTSYDHPSIDSILLSRDLLTEDETEILNRCKSKEEKNVAKEYIGLIGKFRKYFKQISVYEPKEDVMIAITGKRLYEYRLSDTDEILALYEKIQKAKMQLPDSYIYCEETEAVNTGSGLFGGIVNQITGGAKSKKTPGKSAMADSAAVCTETCEEAAADDGGAYYEEREVPSEDAAYEQQDWNTEEYKSFAENRFLSAQTSPFSTFGMDVDTASYANFRKKVFNGRNIPKDAVRTEEMMNYFDYDYADAKEGEKFGVTAKIADTPWNNDTKLLKVGVKSEEADVENIASNVVFLIDTSGSMFDPDKLPLVQKSFLMLLHNLGSDDRVSIVTYAGGDEVICKGVRCDEKEEITSDIVSLEAWGGTNGSAGIKTAYQIAEKYFIEGGNNRVILATDGDLNLGLTSESDLVELIRKEKESGVFLSVLGVGEGNYKDSKMKALADNGNGNFAYIDSTGAAGKALMDDFGSLMYTVAKDAKMQVEFNPAKVKGYRQIGYELRQLETEDFADDTKDGAEVGSGQCVTILYEIVPADSDMEIPGVESKYGNGSAGDSDTDELLTVNIRYKEPDGDKSRLIEIPVTEKDYSSQMDDDMSWAAGVAQTAMLIRDSEYKGTSTYDEIYDRLKQDHRIMEDDNRAQFLAILKKLDNSDIELTDEDEEYYW
ncbi:MAG: DUF3520 domain-containing protein [Lachnospiraceae bacterium]|jgi:Ca-activated chloride channel family protein|nr:DUF3520 domain-containing protein [Lachnospiraceae bacterium]